jgi:hypothetical protein
MGTGENIMKELTVKLKSNITEEQLDKLDKFLIDTFNTEDFVIFTSNCGIFSTLETDTNSISELRTKLWKEGKIKIDGTTYKEWKGISR